MNKNKYSLTILLPRTKHFCSIQYYILILSFLLLTLPGSSCTRLSIMGDPNGGDSSFRNFECSYTTESNSLKNVAASKIDDYETILDTNLISEDDWSESAVRKILLNFAYGSFSSSSQIKEWAKMPALKAISEILTLDTINLKLSPMDTENPPTNAIKHGTLRCLSELWYKDSAESLIPENYRRYFKRDNYYAPETTWYSAVNKRGLNLFRQKIGLWETNYHMSVNQSLGVGSRQVIRFYDDVMNAHAKGEAYQDVIATGALSAAVATQYNHKENVFDDGKFLGNEDFGREIHQLYFGILGEDDPGYHEATTVRNTAKALSGTTVNYINDIGYSDTISFDSDLHYPGDLEILGETISGKTTKEKIEQMVQYSIENEESLTNLPLKIVRGLCDDNLLDESNPDVQNKISIIQNIWKTMKTKNLLDFLRMYAVSTAYHNSSRYKYWTSIDRNVTLTNFLTADNKESFSFRYNPDWFIQREDVNLFRPTHDVFGSQTGYEASESGNIFQQAYNNASHYIWNFANSDDIDEEGKTTWEKDFRDIVPADNTGSYKYHVKEVAEFLWRHLITDDLKNFGTLERANVYTLLASGQDLAYWLDPDNPTKIYSINELETDSKIIDKLKDVEKARILLDSKDKDTKHQENMHVGMAIAFISATPYIFAQEGK